MRNPGRLIRRYALPLCRWSSAAAYMIVVSGIPIPMRATTSKDLTRPFLCMNSACGCHSADECGHHCCCHTLAERLAWARRNHIEPPDFAVAETRVQGVNVGDDCSPPSTCCNCCAKRKTVHRDNSTSGWHLTTAVGIKASRFVTETISFTCKIARDIQLLHFGSGPRLRKQASTLMPPTARRVKVDGSGTIA